MSPDTGTGDDVATCGVPLDICDTVVLNGLHQLQVGSEILLSLNLLTLEVHVPEVKIEAGLGVDGGHNDEATLGRPVNAVAGLFLNCAHKLEVTGSAALLLCSEELDTGLGGSGRTGRVLTGGDSDEAGSIGLPGEVNNGVLQVVNNLNGNTLLLDAENLQVGSHRLLRLGVTVDLDTDVGTL